MASQLSVVSELTNIKNFDEFRRSAKFHPTIWGDYFLSYDSDKTEISVAEHEEHTNLKEMVKKLLAQVPDNSTYKLELIDAIQQLGVHYHFQKEIEKSLQYIYENYTQHNSKDNNLHTIALRFRLLRQEGYNVPCDVFNKFLDNTGNFVESLGNNVEGLLSLYEAAHLGMHKEETLDKAIEFCSSHLQKSLPKMNNVCLSKQVKRALKTPIHKSFPRLHTREFISIYKEDESHNETILGFAKLDFNILQKMHQKELSEVTRWWKTLDIANKMPYARDRVVECYFWILGVFFEPHYAFARRLMVKITAICSIIDDTYEYATLDELQVLTDAIARWDVNLTLEDLPPYIQICYKYTVGTAADIEEEMEKVGASYRVQYAKQEWAKLGRSYFEEAKWLCKNYGPTVEEYMKASLVTSGYMLLATTSLVGMGDLVSKQDFDWVTSEPLIVRASSVICRLMDDLAGDEFEQKPTAVNCYMKQYAVSKDEACGELREQVKKAWKDINEECLEPRPASMEVLKRVVNLARVINLLYVSGDGYSDSNKSKEWIKMVLAEPIAI